MTAVENAAWAVVTELLGTITQYDKLGPTYTLSCRTECFEVSVLLDRRELLEELRDALVTASKQPHADLGLSHAAQEIIDYAEDSQRRGGREGDPLDFRGSIGIGTDYLLALRSALPNEAGAYDELQERRADAARKEGPTISREIQHG